MSAKFSTRVMWASESDLYEKLLVLESEKSAMAELPVTPIPVFVAPLADIDKISSSVAEIICNRKPNESNAATAQKIMRKIGIRT